jgi:hypothetical protein
MAVNAQVPNNQDQAQRNQAESVTAEDVKILNGAITLLSNESAWNRSDDIVCDDDERNDVRSLYCALQKSSVDVLGQYDHDRAALQEVRAVILERTNFRPSAHSLREFNNMPSTTFSDVKGVLEAAQIRVQDRLKALTNPGRPDVQDV